ncbi:MAG: LacI family transcriptional regulator [Chlorobi bacterium]|nr:LacI family transcriptional regulator [Chlorobiota bacterium]
MLKNKKATIKDIAKKLGVHHSTVSRALRDHPDIHPNTIKLIKRTAEQMNYQPNMFARNLKNNQTNLIGVIVPEIKHHFFANAIGGVEEAAHEHGYVIIVCQSNEDYEREVINTKALISNRIEGLLVSVSQTTRDGAHFQQFIDEGGKLVFFDRALESVNASKVIVDDYRGGFKATEYLIKKGKKRIAHLAGTKELEISKLRYQGYRDALKKYNIPFRKNLVFWGGFQEEDGIEGMEYLLKLKTHPDSIFAVNDPAAIGAYEVLERRGLRIPEDIAVVGFSNNPISAFIKPALTTIEQPSYEMGKAAMELLNEMLVSKRNKKTKKILKTKLIIRDSV